MKYIYFLLLTVYSLNIYANENKITVNNTFQLLTAISSTDDSSENKRYLIELNPGIYKLNRRQIKLNRYVRLQGSGVSQTIIQSSRFYSGGGLNFPPIHSCIISADDSVGTSLSDLSVHNFGTYTESDSACGFSNLDRVDNVKIHVRVSAGIAFGGSAKHINNSQILVDNKLKTGRTYGSILFSMNSNIYDTNIELGGNSSARSYGIYIEDGSLKLDNVDILATSTAVEVFLANTDISNSNLRSRLETTYISDQSYGDQIRFSKIQAMNSENAVEVKSTVGQTEEFERRIFSSIVDGNIVEDEPDAIKCGLVLNPDMESIDC